MNVTLSKSGAVRLTKTLPLPLSAAAAWGQLRDFHRFACHDFFHHHIDVHPNHSLTLHHRYLGIRLRRTGRILFWRENLGYAFSDLSLRNPQHAFPHIFAFRLQPQTPTTSLLHLTISGRWTTPWLPRPLTRLYLRLIFLKITTSIETDLLAAVASRPHKPTLQPS